MNRSFCVAPMMRRTDRHFRYLCGILSKEATLFTEMIHANAINRNEPERFLNNSNISNATVTITISGNTGNPSDKGTDTQGSSGTNKNLPPYYAIAYIMRIS